MKTIKIIECPRDAMQGLHDFIPTEIKINYINSLLKCGFDTIDFGSFVSPKAIPQLKDTADVLNGLNLNTNTKLLAIVANERGALDASNFEEINYLGFPFSISETFQQRNTNSSIEDSFQIIEKIKKITDNSKKELVIYLSMGFGNPYGDEWNSDILIKWCNQLYSRLGIKIQALSDTIGIATPESVKSIFKDIIPSLPEVEFGAHLHTLYGNAKKLVQAASEGGCNRFDGAIKGFGGCPMATNTLTGNMPTEILLEWLNENKL
ncbi:MAG: hydroxymethylglutaryl-CoA lyase, partial [Flavobacteriia bacterium]|nr:hydroxymethylglutaryl-CoA lyase [Flavobacteriia bacterium]